MSPRRVAALVLIITLFAATGCVQLPQRVTRTADPRPSLSSAAATALVKRYLKIDTAAWNKLDPSHLRDITTGPELEYDTQAMIMEKRIEGKHRTSDLPKDARYSVSSTPGGHYPALAVISGTRKGGKSADSFYLAERPSAADPWLISYSSGDGLNTFLPELTGSDDRTFTPVGPKTKINGVTANTMTDRLTEALRLPTGKAAERFATNDSFNDAKFVPLDTKESAHQKRTYAYIGAPWQQAYRTGKDDLIVFGAFTQSIRYDYLDNYYTYFKGGAEKKLLPGKYSSLTYSNYWMYAVRVPKKGKIAIQAADWTRENITGDEYDPF